MTPEIPATAARAERLRRLERLERLSRRMDSALRIPGTRLRFGLDGMLGLIPGVGDVLTMVPGAYIVLESYRMGAPGRLIGRQGVNVAIDTLIGTVPLIGDIFDIGFKSNLRNVALLRDHIDQTDRAELAASAGTTGRTPPG